MKLFKQLLVAPAALGFLAPMAAGATEVNVAGVSDYASVSSDAVASEQVTSINQFNDVFPTDWAYQALSNLIERYGCVAGYPNGTYRGNRAMTRFEAAALLNACLDRVTEVTDELKRLMKEFEKELAIVKGRVDGLEARVGELEATQFSTTTKLKGRVDMVLGGLSYGGSGSDDNDMGLGTGSTYTGEDALTFNYTAQFDLNTSFTGKDLLYTRIKTGNFGANFYDQNQNGFGESSLADLAVGNSNGDTLKVDKLWYQFPIGASFTAYVGPKIEAYYMLGSTPSVYRQILKQFKLGGYYGAYGASTSPGVGLAWRQQKENFSDPRFTVSASYNASNGAKSNPNNGGIGGTDSKARFNTQIAYGNPQWNLSAAYQYAQAGAFKGYGTPSGQANYYVNAAGDYTKGSYSDVNSVALRAWWQPKESGWMPSISAGWGLSSFNGPASDTGTDLNYSSTSQNWFVGLNWKDAFMKGNILGAAIAQSNFKTAMKNYNDNGDNGARDGNYSMELYYQFQVTDNIAVTPTIFYLSRPYGQLTGTSAQYGGNNADTFNIFGYLVQTTFRF